jgi:hypothetical protein
MDNNNGMKSRKEEVIKFVASAKLKADAQGLAEERNISLSALLRLVLSEYVRSKA